MKSFQNIFGDSILSKILWECNVLICSYDPFFLERH